MPFTTIAHAVNLRNVKRKTLEKDAWPLQISSLLSANYLPKCPLTSVRCFLSLSYKISQPTTTLHVSFIGLEQNWGKWMIKLETVIGETSEYYEEYYNSM